MDITLPIKLKDLSCLSQERQAEILTEQGRLLIKEKKIPEAITFFEEIIVKEPDNAYLYCEYAKSLRDIKHYKKAELFFSKALNKKPDCISTLFSFARCLIFQKKYDEAFGYFEKILELEPSNIKVLSAYANNLSKVNKHKKSNQLFEQVLRLNSLDIINLNSYANSLLRQGEIQKACQLFEQSLQIDNKHIITLNSYANALLQKGEIEKACQLFEQSLQIDDKNVITLNNYANALLKNGKIEKACQLFEQSLQVENKNVITLNNYANALLRKGAIEKACQLFEQSLRIDDEQVVALNSYASALVRKGEIERACELLEQSLRINDEQLITLNSYANLLLKKGDNKKAFQLLEKALKINPTDIINLNSYAYCLMLSGKFNKAIQFYEKAFKLDPNDVRTTNNYIKALIQFGDYKKIIMIKPQHSYARLQYAKQLEAQGKCQDALSQLFSIDLNTQKDYHANVIRLHIGRLYYRLHQPDLGKKYFEAVVNGPNSADKDQSILYAARSLIAVNPHSEEAIHLLQQIDQTSLKYEEAMKVIALNADSATAYDLFAGNEETFKDNEMLYRSIYHKIGNEVAILKSIAQRLLRKIEGEHPIVKDIVQDLDDLQDSVTRQRTTEKAKIAALTSSSYSQLVDIVSQTAHNISDEVNNILAAIESKTRRALRKINSDDPLKEQFEKLLLQLELTQSALNDLKSINEGIAIRRHRFPVSKLFEKWQPENWSNTPRIHRARIKLRIENPDSEFDGDEEKIKSILNELIENSLKHNAKHSDLLIRIFVCNLLNPTDVAMPTIPGDRQYLYIQVIDNGKGILEDKKEWIFQPLNTTSSEDKGSGLGLFIARKTLQKMSGYIRESGEPGKGARFQIYIPYLSSNEF